MSLGEGYEEIAYALHLSSVGDLRIRESGTFLGIVGSYVPGDVLRVEVDLSQVKYKKNGQVIYTSNTSPTYPLIVDTSLNHTGGMVNAAMIEGDWQ